MNEFVTQMLMTIAMGDWREIGRMVDDLKVASDPVVEPVVSVHRSEESRMDGFLEEPAKEPLLVS